MLNLSQAKIALKSDNGGYPMRYGGGLDYLYPDDEYQEIELWLVLEEDPDTRNGYKIIHDEKEKMFGLATPGTEKDQPQSSSVIMVISWMHTWECKNG